MNAQTAIEALNGMAPETAIAVINQLLAARPELAPGVVAYACPDLTYAPSRGLTERRNKGTVKSFSTKTGFGFFTCPELAQVFGNDVFVHAKQLCGIAPGTDVNFAVALNKDNKPQAYDLQVTTPGPPKGCGKGDKGWNASWPDAAKGKGKRPWESKPAWGQLQQQQPQQQQQQQQQQPQQQNAAEQQILGQYSGRIKSFSVKNGFGFIDCDELKQQGLDSDVFLHQSQIGEFQAGAEITFTAYFNSKGNLQAKDVSSSTGGQQPGGDGRWGDASKKARMW